MDEVAALRLRLADLARLREQHAANGKHHLVLYIDSVIAETEAKLALAEPQTEPKATPQ